MEVVICPLNKQIDLEMSIEFARLSGTYVGGFSQIWVGHVSETKIQVGKH